MKVIQFAFFKPLKQNADKQFLDCVTLKWLIKKVKGQQLIHKYTNTLEKLQHILFSDEASVLIQFF